MLHLDCMEILNKEISIAFSKKTEYRYHILISRDDSTIFEFWNCHWFPEFADIAVRSVTMTLWVVRGELRNLPLLTGAAQQHIAWRNIGPWTRNVSWLRRHSRLTVKQPVAVYGAVMVKSLLQLDSSVFLRHAEVHVSSFGCLAIS